MSFEEPIFLSKEKGEKIELRNFYKEKTDKMRKKYPEIIEEIQEVARKVGFKDVLINPSLQATAQAEPEGFSETVFWSERSIENINILKKFAPEFSSKGIKIITIHEKEHLRGPAREMIGAEERFIKKGEWGGIQELQEKLPRIKLFREHQTRIQSFIKLADYKDLFEKERCPDIAEAVAIEEIFTDFTSKGPISLEEEVPNKTWQEYLPFFKLEFINKISQKDKEIRIKLLKDYRSWQKEQNKF